MKIKQKGLLCITIVILLALVCGITGCKQNKTAAEIEAEIKQGTMDYLNENYEDTFTITNYLQLAFPGGSGVDLKIQSEKYQEEFSAHVDYEDDGYVYTDTYFKLTMKEDAEKYFYELAKPYLGEDIVVKLQFIGGSSHRGDFNQFIKKYSHQIEVFFLSEIRIEKQEENINQMIDEIISRKISPFFSYVVIKPDITEQVKRATWDEMMDNVSQYIHIRQGYFIEEDFSVVKNEIIKY